MKIFVLAILLLSSNSFYVEQSVDSGVTPFVQIEEKPSVQSVGKYEKCFVILAKIGVESVELSGLIASKQIAKIIPLAIKLAKDVKDDVECFEQKLAEESIESLASKFISDDDCYMVHVRNAAMAVREGVQDIKLGLYQEAIKQILIAMQELKLAQDCPK